MDMRSILFVPEIGALYPNSNTLTHYNDDKNVIKAFRICFKKFWKHRDKYNCP